MLNNNHVKKAQRKVSKAVDIFSKAVEEVELAQAMLREGIEQDEGKVESLHEKITLIHDEIASVEREKEEKIGDIKNNNELLEKLGQFKVTE